MYIFYNLNLSSEWPHLDLTNFKIFDAGISTLEYLHKKTKSKGNNNVWYFFSDRTFNFSLQSNVLPSVDWDVVLLEIVIWVSRVVSAILSALYRVRMVHSARLQLKSPQLRTQRLWCTHNCMSYVYGNFDFQYNPLHAVVVKENNLVHVAYTSLSHFHFFSTGVYFTTICYFRHTLPPALAWL